MKKLGEGTIVDFKISDTEYGTGEIRGVVSELPSGIIYIVELTIRKTQGLKAYPYSHIALPDALFVF